MSKSEDRAKESCYHYALKIAWKHISNCYDLDDDKYLDTALEYCSLAIKINPQNASAYVTRGAVYNQKKHFKRAFKDLNKALSLGLNDEDVYFELGYAHFLCEEYSQAVNNFSNALELNPNIFYLWYSRGCTFSKMELYGKAISDLKIALNLVPDDIDALKHLGNAYLKRGTLFLNIWGNLEAISDFTSATNFKDSVVKAYEGRAAAYTNLGRFDDAKADMAKAKYIHEEQEHLKMNSHD
jgi:tetratricopeptide (TPR) repeat protein